MTDDKKDEKKISEVKTEEQQGRKNIDPINKEETNPENNPQNWTDVAESHLGIDE